MRNPLVCLDARFKLVLTLILLIVCAFVSHISILGILLIILFVCIGLLPKKKEFIRRVSLFLPFIVATFALPLFFTPGKIITHKWLSSLKLTYEGLHRGCVLGIRIFLSIGYSLVFALSTPPMEIAKSLDWITMNKLKLGETLLIALRFAEIIKNKRVAREFSAHPFSTLKYAIEETCKFKDRKSGKHYAKYKTGN